MYEFKLLQPYVRSGNYSLLAAMFVCFCSGRVAFTFFNEQNVMILKAWKTYPAVLYLLTVYPPHVRDYAHNFHQCFKFQSVSLAWIQIFSTWASHFQTLNWKLSYYYSLNFFPLLQGSQACSAYYSITKSSCLAYFAQFSSFYDIW